MKHKTTFRNKREDLITHCNIQNIKDWKSQIYKSVNTSMYVLILSYSTKIIRITRNITFCIMMDLEPKPLINVMFRTNTMNPCV